MRAWLLAIGVVASAACSRDAERLAEELTGGNVEQGEQAFRRYGCGTCHELHGRSWAQGHAGPSLHDFAQQGYLPGGRPNTPPDLMQWIRHPRLVEPRTAMPDLNVNERDARDLAAFLYTLR